MTSVTNVTDPCTNCGSTNYHKKYLSTVNPTNSGKYADMHRHQIKTSANIIMACDQCLDGLQSKPKFCHNCCKIIKTSNDEGGIYFKDTNPGIKWICDYCYLNHQWCDCYLYYFSRSRTTIHPKNSNCRSSNTYTYQFDFKLDQRVRSVSCLHCDSNAYTTGYLCASRINCSLLSSSPIYIIRCDQCISKKAVNQCDHCKQRGLNSYICDECMVITICKDCSTTSCYHCANMDYCMVCGEHNEIWICYSCAKSKHRGYFICTDCYSTEILGSCDDCYLEIFEDSFMYCRQCYQYCHLYCGKIYCQNCSDYTIELTKNCPNCGIVKDDSENCSKCQIKLEPLAKCINCNLILKDLEGRLCNVGIAGDPKHIEYYDWKCNECIVDQMNKIKSKGKGKG